MADYKMGMSEEELLTYLDTNIEHWRQVQAGAAAEENEKFARCYIDAFQSMRLAIFGHMKQ